MENSIKNKLFVYLGLSGLGVLDSFYLTLSKLQNLDAICSLESGCNLVLNSTYSMVGPVPLAAIGLLYYLFVFFGSLIYLSRPSKEKLFRIVNWVVVAGFIFSAYFVYLQHFVLEAYCAYCLTSALITTILFIYAIGSIIKGKKKERRETPQ